MSTLTKALPSAKFGPTCKQQCKRHSNAIQRTAGSGESVNGFACSRGSSKRCYSLTQNIEARTWSRIELRNAGPPKFGWEAYSDGPRAF
jgi:hypothetical protein